jgi:ABC-type uncharacterized transport system substrate-binding protein
MLSALTLLALFSLPKLFASADTPGDSNTGSRATPPPVILIKSAGVRAVQEVADAFSESCRVHVKQIYIGEGPTEVARAREIVQSAQVLVAVGQPAVERMTGVRAHVVYALAPDPPPGVIGTNNSAAPYQVFRALLQLLPKTRRIAAIYSERGMHRMAQARSAARSLQIDLLELPAADSSEAIRALRKFFVPMPEEHEGAMASAPGDALWLGADPQLIDTQVLQFALQMQIMRQVPVVAATRQQVSFGALLAVDWPPDAVGRHLAWQVNQLLEDPEHIDLVARDRPGGTPENVVSGPAAHRLGINMETLRHVPGWKVER